MVLDQGPLPPHAAIEYLAESRYGFSWVDLGVSLQEMEDFDLIEVRNPGDFNRCKDLETMESDLIAFLDEVGVADPDILQRAAARIYKIAHSILRASNRETAWIWLRATPPKEEALLPNWHFDAGFYPSQNGEAQYKFVMTLIGPSTHFYPIPKEEMALRQSLWHRISDQNRIVPLLDPEAIWIPPRGTGVVFLNRFREGAFHTEPFSKHQGRLFFSIVLCSHEEMRIVERRVQETFSTLKKKP